MIKLAIIGTGNVAFHLAQAFFKAENVRLEAIAGRNRDVLSEFKVFSSTFTDLDQLPPVDVIIIAVQDAAIREVSAKLKGTRALVVHTSGSTSMKQLDAHSRYGVLYPLQTFSKSRQLVYSEIPFCIEAKLESDHPILEALTTTLGASGYRLDSEQRAGLHLAAVFGNNFCNHVLTEAKQLCKERQVSFEMLKPLLEETIYKAFDIGPEAAQTGPARRGDQITIDRQLNALHSKSQKELYTSLTRAILTHYERQEL